MTPLNGVYIAMIMKTAPETASAQATRVTNIVLVPGANRPKLVKMKVSHKTTTRVREMRGSFAPFRGTLTSRYAVS